MQAEGASFATTIVVYTRNYGLGRRAQGLFHAGSDRNVVAANLTRGAAIVSATRTAGPGIGIAILKGLTNGILILGGASGLTESVATGLASHAIAMVPAALQGANAQFGFGIVNRAMFALDRAIGIVTTTKATFRFEADIAGQLAGVLIATGTDGRNARFGVGEFTGVALASLSRRTIRIFFAAWDANVVGWVAEVAFVAFRVEQTRQRTLGRAKCRFGVLAGFDFR